VIEGYELKAASIYTQRGGYRIDTVLKERIESKELSTLKPWFDTTLTQQKHPNFTPTQSFYRIHSNDIVRDIKQWMSFVPYKPLVFNKRNEYYEEVLTFPPPFELPDGTVIEATDELCTVPESVLFPYHPTVDITGQGSGYRPARSIPSNTITTPPEASPLKDSRVKKRAKSASTPKAQQLNSNSSTTIAYDGEMDSLTDLVYAAVLMCDVDVRKELLANLVIVGGGSLIDGMAQRLTHELTDLVPSTMKVKTVSSPPIERANAAWIGGSILSICGTFQPMWLSKAEYDEMGMNRAMERFCH